MLKIGTGIGTGMAGGSRRGLRRELTGGGIRHTSQGHLRGSISVKHSCGMKVRLRRFYSLQSACNIPLSKNHMHECIFTCKLMRNASGQRDVTFQAEITCMLPASLNAEGTLVNGVCVTRPRLLLTTLCSVHNLSQNIPLSKAHLSAAGILDKFRAHSMAPKELIGRYKLYKSKTKGLLYWLTKTAGGCCELKTVIKSLAANGTSKTKGEIARLEIRTAELVKLAEIISKADPPVEVPEGVILIVQDVIKGREECAEWYSAQALEGGGKVEKENETHRYFILVSFGPQHSLQVADY